MKTATDLSRAIHELEGQRKKAEAVERECEHKVNRLTKRSDAATSAQAIIQAAAKLTQQQLEYRISELATLALKTVFPDPYQLTVSFEEKRGRTDCVILLQRNDEDGKEGEGVRPMEACGHGVLDVVGLALRLSLWTLRKPRTAPVFILDEPFKNVSRDYQPQVASLLKELSVRLGIQFILVTHEEEIASAADRVFRVSFAKSGSKVVQVKEDSI